MFSQVASIFMDQHQSCTHAGSSLTVAGTRCMSWQSTLAVGLVRRWMASSSRLDWDANWSRLTWATARTTSVLHWMSMATGLLTRRVGPKVVSSQDVIEPDQESDSAGEVVGPKHGMFCTRLNRSVNDRVVREAIQ